MSEIPDDLNDSPREIFKRNRQEHWDSVARKTRSSFRLSTYYHQRLTEIYKHLIPKGLRVLELGCGPGDLLSALEPGYGVGIDLSPATIQLARQRHPHLQFIHADVCEFSTLEKFDFIILSDLVNDLWDVQQLLEKIKPGVLPHTRIIFNFYSHLWQKPLLATQKLGLSRPLLQQNWFTVEDIKGILYLSDFETIKHWEEILFPVFIPFLSSFANRFLVKLWFFKMFALTNFVVARPQPRPIENNEKPMVSVIVPARNEEGNIPRIFQSIPQLGRQTELIFVEGHSKDNTYQAIEKAIRENPKQRCSLFRQTGKGKGDAVRLGFSKANGEILMILDADLTVGPQELPRFYEALISGKAEFVNGSRLVYPMEKKAMRFLNLIANKFFGLAFSWLLNQPIKDTLCGTKVLSRENYLKIAENRHYFGNFDPFGDFDLIFGAAKLNLKIVDLPVHYNERTYGTTNIQRWKHGWLLLRMVGFAARKIKFI